MKTLRSCWPALAWIVLATLPRASLAEQEEVSPAEYERWKTELSNWGRWGADDEIGALNLITPAKRLEALALAREGVSVSLAGDIDTVEAVDNPFPYEHTMLSISSDQLNVRYHGIAHTHIDALAHVNDDGTFYNGYAPDPERTLAEGHERSSIHNLKHGVPTRGVLMDFPRARGVPYLEPGPAIGVEDLEASERETGIRVSAGDAAGVLHGDGVAGVR